MMVSLALPFLVGGAGLAVEFGNALLVKVSNQRVADAAAYAGALAYAKIPTPATSQETSARIAAVEAAVDRVAVLNGIAAAGATSSFGVSPRANSNTAVQVVVTTQTSYFLSRLVGAAATLAVPASSFAEIVAGDTPGCVFALGEAGTGVSLSGGTNLTAPSCSVASASTINSANCNTHIVALTVSYNSATAPDTSCDRIRGPNNTAPTIVRRALTDPLAGTAGVSTATSRLSTVAAMTSPSAPAAPAGPGAMGTGTSIDFGYSMSVTQSKAIGMGCIASYVERPNTWTFNCPAGTTTTFETITIGGNIRVVFGSTGNTSNVYNFRTTLNSSSNGFSFGPGQYNFAQDFVTSGGGTNSFGAGNFAFGRNLTHGSSGSLSFGNGNTTVVGSIMANGNSTVSFGTGTIRVGGSIVSGGSATLTIAGAPSVTVRGGIIHESSATMTLPASVYTIGQSGTNCNGGLFSICKSNGPLIIGGPSTYVLSSGLAVTGGTGSLSFTGGTMNSYRIGRGSNGYSITVGGGAKLSFADAINGLFTADGQISTAGGSCLTLPAAAEHDINGSIDGAGAFIFGAGVYSINGYVAFGRSNGGGGGCPGGISVKGTGVTFVLSGTPNLLSQCGNDPTPWSFCVAAGYSNIDLTAPTSGTTAKLLVIGPQVAGNTTGATFSGGASGINMSGAFYYPKGPIQLGGGAGMIDTPGSCLTLVGSQVTLTGGAVAASSCISSAGGAGRVVVVR